MNARLQAVHEPRRIVVGMDFSEAAEHALALAAEVAGSSRQGAQLHVVHVAPVVPVVVLPIGGGELPMIPNLPGSDRLQRQLEERCGALASSAPTRVGIVPHMLFGDAVTELMHIAVTLDADLIIVGAHEHHGWWHKSRAASLARRAPCSVLTAREKTAEGGSPRVM